MPPLPAPPVPRPVPSRGVAPLADVPAWSAAPTLGGRLNRDWLSLRDSPAATARLHAWADAHLVLAEAGCGSVAELEWRVKTAPGRDGDRLLLALLQLARTDELAARLVLQVMLPKALRLAGTQLARQALHGTSTDRDEAQAVAVAALWEVIRTYPVATRRRRVAANLALDALSLVHRGRVAGAVRTGVRELPVSGLEYPGAEERLRAADRQPVDAELLTVLAAAVRDRVVGVEEARLLARVYGVDES
ncbi:MAG: hypothetical protein M3P95_10130, partial [Actinomycetota bacterium]|nr:hypothetical protein [Actinomycetota bacterium]